MKKIIIFRISLSFLLLSAPILIWASSSEGTIDTDRKYAWGEKTGWVNFNPKNGNVTITDSGITGYAWSENYGWINLSPTNAGVKNDGEGNLLGKAWNDKLGWIDFSGITVDDDGNFSGTTGVENSTFGRLSFVCSQCGVATDWRPESEREDDDDDDDDKNNKDDDLNSAVVNNSIALNSSNNDSPLSEDILEEGGKNDENREDIAEKNIKDSIFNKSMNNPNNIYWLLFWLFFCLLILLFLRKRRLKKNSSIEI